jgi:DNA-directed RNA polymerase subunit RPC12/RpoP
MENDLTKCPECGGEADNGHDRCVPPNVYTCTKCENENTTDEELT